MRIPGIGARIAEVLSAEFGLDMDQFPTAANWVELLALFHRAAEAVTVRGSPADIHLS
jgi:hypothetical protein